MQLKENFLKTKLGVYLPFLILAFCLWYLAYSFDQDDFFNILPFYTLAFAAWIFVMRADLRINQILWMGILLRLGLIGSFPSLSDDIYRFFWDGTLIIQGLSPYGILPSDVVSLGIPNLDQTLYNQLNSPSYYTIYPPINQLYFALGSIAKNISLANVIMKCLIILTEVIGYIFIIKILKQNGLKPILSSLYFLNPLVIIEGSGNLHFEVVMIPFLCISIYYVFNNKLIYGALWMAISIGVKLLPLMILPYFWFNMGKKDRNVFFGSLILFCTLIFLPLITSIGGTSFMSSVDLYFRKFEFNASIYYLFRYLGQQISGYNLIRYIGPALAVITLGSNLFLASSKIKYTFSNFARYGLISWSIYLLLATTVHPWYVITILFFSIFTDIKYPSIWTYLIFISYVNYSYPRYYENSLWIFFEYVVLFIFIIVEYKHTIRYIKKRDIA